MAQRCTDVVYARRQFTDDGELRQLAREQRWTHYKQSQYLDVVLCLDRQLEKLVLRFRHDTVTKPNKETRSCLVRGVKCSLVWLPDQFA